MNTATVQQIGQNLAAWLDAAQHGETIAIVDNGRVVARLTPPEKTEAPPAEATAWPDFAARRRAIFGESFMLPAGTLKDLINEDRGEERRLTPA